MKILLVLVIILTAQIACSPIVLDLTKGASNKIPIAKENNKQRFLLSTTVPLRVDKSDNDFTVRIGIGSPAQYFDIQLDTTSSVTWVPSSNRFKATKTSKYTTQEYQNNRTYNGTNNNTNNTYNYTNNTDNNTNSNTNSNNYSNSNTNSGNYNDNFTTYDNTTNQTIKNIYDETRSSKSQNTNRTIKIEYEDGDVKGIWTYDSINIENLAADGFAFVQVTEYDDDYTMHRGGKLGLGLHSKHGEKFNLLSVLQTAGVINKRMFSIQQNRNGGRLFLGDYPLSTYFNVNKFSKCNVSSTEGLDDEYRDGWVCDVSHILLGDVKNLTNALEVDGRVIFDASYQYIRAPKNFIKYFKNYFNSKNITNCRETSFEDEKRLVCANQNDLSKLKSIAFVLEGTAYRLNAEELFEKTAEGFEFLIRFRDDSDNIWTLGSAFMSQYTIVFDMEDYSIGFSGGDRVDYNAQWNDWYNGNSQADKANRFFYMIVGASIFGSILFIFIVFLVVHSIRRKRLEEHGPLINERH